MRKERDIKRDRRRKRDRRSDRCRERQRRKWRLRAVDYYERSCSLAESEISGWMMAAP